MFCILAPGLIEFDTSDLEHYSIKNPFKHLLESSISLVGLSGCDTLPSVSFLISESLHKF